MTFITRAMGLTALLACCGLPPVSARAQSLPPDAQAHGTHDQHGDASASFPVLCPLCPVSREAAGTSWQPDASASHDHPRRFGDWQATFHLQTAVIAADERGPRGDDGVFSTNFLMVNARRRAGRGVFGVQSMWTLEPAIGRRGYPLLLQTGETADGTTPLVDRQHPHDLPMELAVTYSRPFGDDRAVFLYAAAVGAPALGPPAFMHRAASLVLPVSPITHHWFDASHVTYGVVTLGAVVSPGAKLEASVFRGREPDQRRWGFEAPALDSFAFRLSVNPSSHLALQVSAGVLNDAEQLHPGADVTRLTASLMYSGEVGGRQVDALAAWGRNRRSATSFPVPGGRYVMPSGLGQATLAEATVRLAARQAVVTRFEWAQKDEMFGLDDERHATIFPVMRLTAGYAFDVVRAPTANVAVGAAWSWNRVDRAIRPDYGGSPSAVQVFIQLMAH